MHTYISSVDFAVKAAFVALGISIFAAFTAPSTVLADGPNLIKNPSLENPSSTGTTPANWSKVYWGNVAPSFQYPVAGQSGASAAKITMPSASSGDARWAHAMVAIEPGAKYRFTGWYSSNTATEVDLEFKGSTGTTWGWLASVPSSGGTWKQVSGTFTAPANASTVRVFHLISNKGTLTIDNYSLVKVSTLPPPATGAMVSITFDDSWTSQYTNALPILENNSLKGTFYFTTEPVIGGWEGFMTPSQVRTIANKGHEAGDHTVSHANLTTLSAAQIDYEVRNSKAYLEQLTGKSVTTIAYPYGAVNTSVIERVQAAGYRGGRSAIDDGLNGSVVDPYNLSAFAPENTTSTSEIKASIDRAAREGLWYILAFHEIDESGNQYSNSTAQFREIINYIKASGIRVVTVDEGLRARGF